MSARYKALQQACTILGNSPVQITEIKHAQPMYVLRVAKVPIKIILRGKKSCKHFTHQCAASSCQGFSLLLCQLPRSSLLILTTYRRPEPP